MSVLLRADRAIPTDAQRPVVAVVLAAEITGTTFPVEVAAVVEAIDSIDATHLETADHGGCVAIGARPVAGVENGLDANAATGIAAAADAAVERRRRELASELTNLRSLRRDADRLQRRVGIAKHGRVDDVTTDIHAPTARIDRRLCEVIAGPLLAVIAFQTASMRAPESRRTAGFDI